MNILFLSEERVSSGMDGHGSYLRNLCNELQRNGYNIFIIYNKKNKFYNTISACNYNITLIDISSRNLKKCINFKNILKIRNQISDFVKKNSIDYIHCSSVENLYFLPSNLNIQISVNHHSAEDIQSLKKYNFYKFSTKFGVRNYFKKVIKEYLFNYKKADIIICSGKKSKQSLIYKYKVKNKKILTFFNAPNLNLNKLENIRDSLNIRNSEFLIIGIGRLQFDKGVEDFCKIAKKLNSFENIKFIYVGPNKNKSYSENIISKYKKYVHFLGPREDINNLLYSSDLFLFLSHRESFPLILLEAFSIPVLSLTWDVVGCDEVINDNTGISISFNNYKLLENKILEIFKDPKKFNSVREGAKGFANEHSIKKLVNLYCSEVFI